MTEPSSNPFEFQGPKESSMGIDWKRAIHIFQRYFWIVILFGAAGLSLAYVSTKRQIPLYRTQATVIISSQLPSYLGSQLKSNLSDITEDYWNEKRYLETQFEIIRSSQLSLFTAQRMKPQHLFRMLGTPQFSQREPTPLELQRAAAIIRGSLQVVPRSESRIVGIMVVHSDPFLAKVMANAVADSYIEENLKRRLSSTKSASTWLDKQLGVLRDKLDNSEKLLYKFKIDNKIMDISLDQHMKTVSAVILNRTMQVEKYSTELLLVETKLQKYRSLRKKDPASDAAGDFLHSASVAALRTAYYDIIGKLQALKVDLLERNPLILKQEKMVELSRKNLRSELQLMDVTLSAEYSVAVTNLGTMRKWLDSTREEALALGKVEIEYKKLERERNETTKLYELVLARLKETGLAEELKTNNIRMLDPAVQPRVPFKPVLVLNLALGLALGLFLGICVLILLYYLDNTLKSQEEVEQYLHASFLGHIPLMPHHMLNTPEYDLFIFNHPRSSIAESVRSIRTNIMFMSPDKRIKTLVVTSASPLEGKTTLSSYLAISMAMSGEKTLIVDADMRKPRIHKVFSMKPQHGFSSLIVGKSTYDEAIFETHIPNLFVLPCGPIPPNPAELQQSDHFDVVFEGLRDRFDRIVFDSPPVGLVADPAIIGQKVDGVIVVTRFGQTTRHMLKNAFQVLSRVKINILGGIMNYVDEKRWGQRRYYSKAGQKGRYGYYYQSNYGYYGEGDPEEPAAKPQQGKEELHKKSPEKKKK
ncbi:polysaccharide biosynthesis tyrosine autokinase [Myxococcota bacterium]|nr:polysaccharide biosynthesis tyrosine autokinase [Myxococcota bacterium]MBU1535206.1 polysaccharide biosynthesis tyrosine autokinase [Myxococcota bacterium]